MASFWFNRCCYAALRGDEVFVCGQGCRSMYCEKHQRLIDEAERTEKQAEPGTFGAGAGFKRFLVF